MYTTITADDAAKYPSLKDRVGETLEAGAYRTAIRNAAKADSADAPKKAPAKKVAKKTTAKKVAKKTTAKKATKKK